MRIQRLCAIALFTLLAVPSAAQSPAGTWQANVDSPGFGSIPTLFSFKVEGAKLTGLFANSFIPLTPITDGAVKGDQVSFKVRLQSRTFGYKGTLKGNELMLTGSVVDGPPLDGAQGEMRFTLRRDR